MRRISILFVLGFSLFLDPYASGRSQRSEPGGPASPKSELVRVALVSPSLFVSVAQAKGFFQQQNLEVQLTVTGNSGKQIEGMVQGNFDIGHQAASAVIRAVEDGKDLVLIMKAGGKPLLSLVVQAETKSYADLRGKVLVVDDLRAGYTFLLKRMLAQNGLGIADYRLEAVGNSQNRYNALKGRTAAGALLTAPYDLRAAAEGLRILDTTRPYLPDEYPGSAVAVRRAWAKDHSDALTRYIRAHVTACQWLLDPSHKEEAIAIQMRAQNLERTLAAKAYEQETAELDCDPQLSPKGLTAILEEMRELGEIQGPLPEVRKYLEGSPAEKAR